MVVSLAEKPAQPTRDLERDLSLTEAKGQETMRKIDGVHYILKIPNAVFV